LLNGYNGTLRFQLLQETQNGQQTLSSNPGKREKGRDKRLEGLSTSLSGGHLNFPVSKYSPNFLFFTPRKGVFYLIPMRCGGLKRVVGFQE